MLRFTYRTSPGPMTGSEFHTDLLTPGIVTAQDPPITAAGMTVTVLDQHGHLMYFEARPPQLLEPAKAEAVVNWTPLFEAAGLDPSKLQPAEPLWTWLSTSDTRAAWTSQWPESGRPLRVEAAALRGKPVGFSMLGPWDKPWRTTSPEGSVLGNPVFLLQFALLFAILVGAPLLARNNLLRGRGDRKGALRLAVFLFVVHMLLWLCQSHVIASLGTLGMFLLALCTSSFAALLVWTAYLALEPYVRRNWPTTLISWTSLLSGRLGDPIVGRDVLIGMLAALVLRALGQGINAWVSHWQPELTSTETLAGLRGMLGSLLQQVPYAVRNPLFFLFLIFLLRVALRNQWIAAAAFAGIFTALSVHPNGDHALIEIATAFTIEAIVAIVLLRWGLLAGVFAYWLDNVLDIPIGAHSSAWYHGYAVAGIILFVAIAAWALRTSIRGRALFPERLFT